MENIIELKTITEILGHNFYIPEYQRGYRWTKDNVEQLLNDIREYRNTPKNANTFYCLQPLVVRNKTWVDASGNTITGYELIDGQQRLTTIHRILKYLTEDLKIESFSQEYEKDCYTIDYKTRPETKEFLNTNKRDETKPDLYYLSKAYETIQNWFSNLNLGRSEKSRMLDTILPSVISKQTPEWSIQMIWYQIEDTQQKSEELFTRLNRGKIPLTSAELIKATFVNADSFKEFEEDDKTKHRTQLIQIWDEIENQLNQPKFWAFISNDKPEKYTNKIEYLFDIISGKPSNNTDHLYSFIHFFNPGENADSLWQKWMSVEKIYRSLLYWHNNKDLYHKIGYLIATGTSVKTLVELMQANKKNHFNHEINKLISATIPKDWEDLRYDNRSDHEKIIHTLLLVNMELTRTNNNNNDFFPLENYKNITKSLEHIHSQNIEGIDVNKKEHWLAWLNEHTSILLSVATDKERAYKVLRETKIQTNNVSNFTYNDFRTLSEAILSLIPTEGNNENDYLHTIQNLALIGSSENTSLSNSVFEVKRRKLLHMDKAGIYVPLATKRIFLKYYSNDDTSNYSIWTKAEREEYFKDLCKCLSTYPTIQNI